MGEIPEWAMQIGRTIADKHAMSDNAYGGNIGFTWCVLDIALALVAERERAAKIAETIRQIIHVDGEVLDYAAPPQAVAAAIRKGE